LPDNENVSIDLFRADGALVRSLVHNTIFTSGNNRIVVHLDDLPAGVYFIKLTTANGFGTKKLILN
jgi:hypothetical protein